MIIFVNTQSFNKDHIVMYDILTIVIVNHICIHYLHLAYINCNPLVRYGYNVYICPCL